MFATTAEVLSIKKHWKLSGEERNNRSIAVREGEREKSMIQMPKNDHLGIFLKIRK